MKKLLSLLVPAIILLCVVNLITVISAANADVNWLAKSEARGNYFLRHVEEVDFYGMTRSLKSEMASAYYLKAILEEEKKQTRLLQKLVNNKAR